MNVKPKHNDSPPPPDFTSPTHPMLGPHDQKWHLCVKKKYCNITNQAFVSQLYKVVHQIFPSLLKYVL